MSILYAVVAQGPVVLARYASCAGNFQEVAEQILSQVKVDSGPPRMTYTHDHYLTHYVISHGIIYLCMTEDVSSFVKFSHVLKKVMIADWLEML